MVIVSSFYVYSKFEVIYNIFIWIQMFAHIKRIDIQIFWMLNRNSFLGGRGGGG